MSTVLIYRKPIRNQFSIELLFADFKNVNHYTLYNDFRSPIKAYCEIKRLKKSYGKFHITGDVHWIQIFLLGCSVSHTYHDFNHYESLFGVRRLLYFIFWILIPMIFAERIVYISPYTQKKSPLKWIAKRKEVVIPNAIRMRVDSNLETQHVDFKKEVRILAFNTSLNKNVSTLLSVLSTLTEMKFLVNIVGGRMSFPLPDNVTIKYHQNLAEEDLIYQYRFNDLLWFVSHSEGFGMPILEAQANHLPVITKGGSSMGWVGGKGAYYIHDSLDKREISQGLKDIITNFKLRSKLISGGLLNLSRFSQNEFTTNYNKVFSEKSK